MAILRTLLATILLTAFSIHSASAQSPELTNADVTRLVAMGVSDETVIAVIKEAKATHFDLSASALGELAVSRVSTAIIGAMRQASTPSAALEQSPTVARPQTLADAAAAAQSAKRTSTSDTLELGRRTYVSSSASPSTSAAAKSEGTPAATTATTTTTIVKDEAYWRARCAPLLQKIHDNLVKIPPLESRINDLTNELAGIGALNARRGGVETERQRLITEVQTLRDTVSADTKALKDIEEEGRQAGALPGWFRN
jgi:hypothetical protein